MIYKSLLIRKISLGVEVLKAEAGQTTGLSKVVSRDSKLCTTEEKPMTMIILTEEVQI